MKLQDFVSETLKEIIVGVKESQGFVSEHGGKVSPDGIVYTEKSQHMAVPSDNWAIVFNVDFDVAVTATEGTSSKGGIGIFVGAVSLGTEGRAEALNQSISHIKFSVPITYPKG